MLGSLGLPITNGARWLGVKTSESDKGPEQHSKPGVLGWGGTSGRKYRQKANKYIKRLLKAYQIQRNRLKNPIHLSETY